MVGLTYVFLYLQQLIKIEVKEAHVEHKRHLGNLHWSLAPCEMCDSRFNTMVALSKHFASEKHKAAKVWIKSTKMEHEALVSLSYLLIYNVFLPSKPIM